MNATPSQSLALGSGRLCSVLNLLALVALAAQTGAAEKDIAAVLKLHELSFVYRADATVLSCGEIEGRVASVLRVLGAREDLNVRASGCDTVVSPTIDTSTRTWEGQSDTWNRPRDPWDTAADPWESSAEQMRRRRVGPRQSAHVRIRAMMPVEVTPEVLAEIKKDKSRRELISRVTGDPTASMNEPIVFPAERRTVTLSRQTLDLHPSECELLEQMSRSVFKELDARVLKRASCGRDRVSHIPPRMTVEALLPALPDVPTLSPAAQGEPTPSSEREEQAEGR